MSFDTGIPNIRVVIREASDENLTVDLPNVAVTIEQGSQYNVNIVPNTATSLRTGSFNTYADFAGFAYSASIGTADTASYALFAVTASYVSGAASTWDTIANKPDGLVSRPAHGHHAARSSAGATAAGSSCASHARAQRSTWRTPRLPRAWAADHLVRASLAFSSSILVSIRATSSTARWNARSIWFSSRCRARSSARAAGSLAFQ